MGYLQNKKKTKTEQHQTALGTTENVRKVIDHHFRVSNLKYYESIIPCPVKRGQ